MKYKCEKCNKEIELLNQTMIVRDGKVIVKEAQCCKQQMKQLDANGGMPTIIRNEN